MDSYQRLMNSHQLLLVAKGGRVRRATDKHGLIIHAVPGPEINGFWGTKALCGTYPKGGYGWDSTTRVDVPTCPKCLKKLANLSERA